MAVRTQRSASAGSRATPLSFAVLHSFLVLRSTTKRLALDGRVGPGARTRERMSLEHNAARRQERARGRGAATARACATNLALDEAVYEQHDASADLTRGHESSCVVRQSTAARRQERARGRGAAMARACATNLALDEAVDERARRVSRPDARTRERA